MTSTTSTNSKIAREHLERRAYVYIRQSSQFQVEQHQEGRRRQYDLVQQVCDLGWPKARVIVIDEDQGKSGSLARTRPGFERLVKTVGRGEVGMVMSLEASRLARNSPDWHNLVYMCRFTNTLIADEYGIYDPSVGTDRMVLGMRGQMSELELDFSIHRMVEARWSKARSAGYLVYPPAGYELDDLEKIVMTSDEAVSSAIRTVFKKFDEFQIASRVFSWWRDEGLRFPVRRYQQKSKPIVWVTPEYRHIRTVLHNPIYAGAYVFGRSQSVREVNPNNPQRVRVRQVKREAWPVFIKDNHPGYISWDKFEEIKARLEDNQQMQRRDHDAPKGPAREGQALLQGLVRCGHCGRGMQVGYGGSCRPARTSTTLQYRCSQLRKVGLGKNCQVVGGKRIDNVVVDAFLEATQFAGQEAARLAACQIQKENEEAEKSWALQIEKAAYEAERAERQFHAVEPENRIVARTLEARWEARLQELEELRSQAEANRTQRRPLTAEEVKKARLLGQDVGSIWTASTTTNQDRKQLLRAAIQEVQLSTEKTRYRVKIIWAGDAVTEREVKRFKRGNSLFKTPEDTVEMVRKLATEFDDKQICRVLNKQGRRTGHGNPFTAHKVAQLRNRNGIPNCPKKEPQDPKEGPFTADEAAAELGVTYSTIHRWLRNGTLPGRQLAPGAPWRIILTDELRRKLKSGEAPEGWVGLTQASKELGLTKPQVAYLVKTGKLPAVRTAVGTREYWRIDVSSATCGQQKSLFEQTNNKRSEEA